MPFPTINKSKLASCMPSLLVCLAAFAYAAVQAVKTSNGQWDAIVVFMLFAIAAWYFNTAELTADEKRISSKPNLHSRIVAWMLLICAIAVSQVKLSEAMELSTHIAVAIAATAIILFFQGPYAAFSMSLPMALFCILVPMREQFILMVSYPLRLVSTFLAVKTLGLLGVAVQSHLTTITMPGAAIVITDACSGVEQLEAMMLVGYIIIKMHSQPTIYAICQYLFMLPVIIIANAGRVILTIVLYKAFGETILGNTWHAILGYVMVFVCSLLIIASRKLFPSDDDAPNSDDAATSQQD